MYRYLTLTGNKVLRWLYWAILFRILFVKLYRTQICKLIYNFCEKCSETYASIKITENTFICGINAFFVIRIQFLLEMYICIAHNTGCLITFLLQNIRT